MKSIDGKFVGGFAFLVSASTKWKLEPGRPQLYQRDVLDILRARAVEVQSALSGAGLSIFAEQAGELVAAIDKLKPLPDGWFKFEGQNQANALYAMEVLTNYMPLELGGRFMFMLDPARRSLFRQPELFGRTVFDAFPSAAEDISEAGSCLAVERATACVLHLMRVLEIGLAALAATVGVGSQSNWGEYLRKIEGELKSRVKEAGARSADEQFYAEAAAHFDMLRRAWRNPSMHPEKSYSAERAEDILAAVKSFMVHLATRLKE